MDALAALLTMALGVRVASYTAPASLSDTAYVTNPNYDPCAAGPLSELNPVTVKLYWALVGQANWTPIYLRSHVVQPGARDTFLLDDSRPATYWLEPNNAAGPGCRSGITVGTSTTSVPDAVQRWRKSGWRRFDVMGRRMEAAPSGRYFGRDTLVIR